MNNRIYLYELPCYQMLNIDEDSSIYKSRNRCFHLDKLPTEGLRKELRAFIEERGNGMNITVLSLRSEIWLFGILCRFLNDKVPNLDSLSEISEEHLVKMMKAWLLKNGYKLSTEQYKKHLGKIAVREAETISYLRRVYVFLQPKDERPEVEKDVWQIDKLGIDIWKSPIHNIKTLNFSKIPQDNMKEQTKQASHMDLRYKAFGTVTAQLIAVNRFTKFLYKNYPYMKSFRELRRDHIESYLIYLNTEADDRKCFRSDLLHLKSVLNLIGRINDWTELCNLFLESDIPRPPETLYKSYSDEELLRLNAAIVEMDEQIARALILHQMLGTRISDTLTLLQDCLSVKNGKNVITINQIKSRRSFSKTVNEDVIALIKSSIRYTKEHYGDNKYVFVFDKDNTRPMAYATIQYRLMVMIRDNDLRDDDGELFGVGTHLFRHSYGRKLTEMHVDDETIAKLLGHANNSSVKYYRKMSNVALAAETKEMRQSMDNILKDLIKGW